MSAFCVHMGHVGDYLYADRSYTTPRQRMQSAVAERYGLLDERSYKTCERCACFMSGRKRMGKAIECGAVPSWVQDDWGFCKIDGWDDIELTRRDMTCEDWRES